MLGNTHKICRFWLLLFVPWISLASAAPPPVEAFGGLPAQSDVVLSPDGHWLAWQDHTQARPRVIMFDLQARKVQRVLAVPENGKVRRVDWSDNETLLISLSATREASSSSEVSREFFRTIAQDVSGGDGRMLPEVSGTGRTALVPLASLVATHTSKPHTVIMATRGSCRAVLAGCLWEVDTRTGRGTVIKVGNEFTAWWVVDRDGRAVAREDWDYRTGSYRVFALRDDEIKEIYRQDDSEYPKLQGLLPDGTAVVLLAAKGRSRQAAWALPLDGSPPRVLAEDADGDIESVYADNNTGAIVGFYVSGRTPMARWSDPAAQRRQEALDRAFGGRQIAAYGWTKDGTKALAYVQTPSTPPMYYLVDFSSHRADIAAEEYPGLAQTALGDVKAIEYTARDGTVIPAYLTTPTPKPVGPAPLVVMPHGGPQARDYLQFDWLAQFLASRGYVVLQPQFRGSTGFGDAFREAGYRQWGGLMQDDITDGIRAMIDQKVADPRRICIIGASYGGYAALAGVAFTPELYSCAVSINGVSDIAALMREVVPIYGGTLSTSLADWKAHIGSPNDPNLVAKSPINYVKNINAPILLMYGTGDGVVPTAQSIQMARALKGAGKPVTIIPLQGEDHWLSNTATRVQVLRELEAFLQAHL